MSKKLRLPTAQDNIGIAGSVASKFVKGRYGVEIRDSEEFSDACLGLIKAEATYDSTRKVRFSTYAYVCAYREVLRGLKVRCRCKEMPMNGYDVQVIDDRGTKTDAERREDRELAIKLLGGLETSERNMELFVEYLLGTTQVELSERYGISRQRVEQIINHDVIPKIQDTHADLIERHALVELQ